MKKMKQIFALLIAMVMVLGMSTAVFAQTVGTAADGKGSITISNASKGETYAVYKLFDATVKADGTSIAYTGTIPSTLTDYFEYVNGTDGTNGINAKASAKKEDGTLVDAARDAIAAWAETQTAAASVVSDGSELTFQGLDYGYYAVTTTQGEQTISVDSTMPNVTIIDKNTTPPVNQPTKTADDDDVFIGQTVTYTVSFGTANYDGTEQITKYTIADNFANGVLTNVKVKSVKVGGTDIGTTTDGVYSIQFVDGKIAIDWIDKDGNNLYANGATLEITYEATVAASAAIDGAGNTNSVTITYTTDEDHPYEIPVTETVYTYAVAIQKVDQAGAPLAGAKFQLPFYVQATADATDGAYIYAGTTAGDGLVNELTTPASGLIIIKGVETGTYSFTETEAPKGYNKLGSAVSVKAVKTGETTTSSTTYYDKDGNVVEEGAETVDHTVVVSIDELAATPVVVVNKTGAELPSTGGIGTTIFYIIGAILVIGAGVVLVTRRRMNAN